MPNQSLISHLFCGSSLGIFYIQYWHQIPFKNSLNEYYLVRETRTDGVYLLFYL